MKDLWISVLTAFMVTMSLYIYYTDKCHIHITAEYIHVKGNNCNYILKTP